MNLNLWKKALHVIIISVYANSCFAAGFSGASMESQDILNESSDSTLVNDNDEILVIPPLFEYVIAPDDLPDLQSRTDYLMDNFWNPFDFKNTKFVDQIALNHAFGVYTQAMTYASKKHVLDSVKKLIRNIKDNPGLSLQFAKAAEENLYGPMAVIWSDEIYMLFLQNLVDNKKLDKSKKRRYKTQLDLLKRTALGESIPDIALVTEDGTHSKFQAQKDFQLVVFTVPNCEDCKYSNVKMDISSVVNDMIEDGRLDVILIMTGYPVKNKDYPDKWLVFSSENAKDIMDLRLFPCFYIVDKNKKIRGKNLSVDNAIELLEMLAKEKN